MKDFKLGNAMALFTLLQDYSEKMESEKLKTIKKKSSYEAFKMDQEKDDKVIN